MFREGIGPGVTLAQVTQADARELFVLIDRERARLRPWFPWTDGTRTVADTRAFIAGSLQRFAGGDGADATIREGDAIIGIAGCLARPIGRRTFEVGYWLAESATGRGIATAAARRIVEGCFRVLDADRVVIRAAVGNERSRLVPRRLGFRDDGSVLGSGLMDPPEDLTIHSISREAWAAAADDSGGPGSPGSPGGREGP